MNLENITFQNIEHEVIANYPKSNKKTKVKVLQTFGEWEGFTGKKYVGDWFTNNEMYNSKESCEVGERFTLYRQGKDGSLYVVGEFKPVYSYYVEGDEHVDTMGWKGEFHLGGTDYEWEGRCVWEISNIISMCDALLDKQEGGFLWKAKQFTRGELESNGAKLCQQ